MVCGMFPCRWKRKDKSESNTFVDGAWKQKTIEVLLLPRCWASIQTKKAVFIYMHLTTLTLLLRELMLWNVAAVHWGGVPCNNVKRNTRILIQSPVSFFLIQQLLDLFCFPFFIQPFDGVVCLLTCYLDRFSSWYEKSTVVVAATEQSHHATTFVPWGLVSVSVMRRLPAT